MPEQPDSLADGGKVCSLVLLTLLFASLYRILSGNRLLWCYALSGAMVAAVGAVQRRQDLADLLPVLFQPEGAYGAAGSVMVFLLWCLFITISLSGQNDSGSPTRFEWMETVRLPLPATVGKARLLVGNGPRPLDERARFATIKGFDNLIDRSVEGEAKPVQVRCCPATVTWI